MEPHGNLTEQPLAETSEGRRVLAELRALLGELGGVRSQPRDDTDLERELGLGSLERVELIARLERAFGVRLADGTLVQATTPRRLLGAVVEALEREPRPESARGVAPALPTAAASAPPEQARTLVEVLLARAERDPDRPHVFLADEDGGERVLTFDALLHGAAAVGAGLRERGVRSGARVALMLPTGEEFFAAFLGTLLAGAVPVPLYPPLRADRLEEYVEREARVLRNAGPDLLIGFDLVRVVTALIRDRAPSIRAVTTVTELAAGAPPASPGAAVHRPDDLALIQYTSGSTGDPKGVALTHRNVLGNIRAIGAATGIGPDDVGVSWVPLYHDMGLIGTWLTALHYGVPLVVLSPLAFLARPERWLRAIHRHRGTISPAPNFGYELCARKVPDEALEGLDLSSWRIAMSGSEPVRPDTIDRFCARFAPCGFRREAMTPGYGLAECSAALLLPPIGRGPRVERGFLSCGAPLPGHEVRLIDASGRDVADGVEGRLLFRGPSATAGYFRRPEKTAELVRPDGWLDSGDIAFRRDGEVFICGRVKDVVIQAGRKYHPTDIEAAAERAPGVAPDGTAAFGVTEGEVERIVVAAEWQGPAPGDEARALLAAAISKDIADAIGTPPDRVALLPPGSIPKTSSGKVRRSAARSLYLEGGLGAVPRRPLLQVARLALRGTAGRVARLSRRAGALAYGLYAAAAIVATLAAGAAVFYCIPRGRARAARRLARGTARVALTLAGLRPRLTGGDRLPGGPAVLVVNHASYLDALVMAAVLPEGVRHVAMAEIGGWPVLGRVARQGGHVLVDRARADRAVGAYAEAKDLLARGERVLFFPEAGFRRAAGLRPFRLGAFQLAAEAGRPVVPIALRGTRGALPDGAWLPRRVPIEVEVAAPIAPGDEPGIARIVSLRDRALAAIAARVDEPVLETVVGGVP